MSSILLTGFPGFLGSRLLPRLLHREPAAQAVCLVQDTFAEAATKRRADLIATDPGLAGRIELVVGDITSRGLGLDDTSVRAGIEEIWHLAAVYDLSVSREVGLRVNAEGTANVLEFAAGCPNLGRMHYISTCYVSGRHCGIFAEGDLDVGQSFNNYYEETKFLAERSVAAARRDGLPTTVYRPAIVVGDSATGETQKYDGPYFLLQWLLRQPRWAVAPVVGDPTMTRFTMVPSDFVIDSMEYLSGLPASAGVTYHLADPHPLTVDELLTAMADDVDRRCVRVPLPRRLTRWTLQHVPLLETATGFPAEAIDYFVHPTHYATTNTDRDLEGSGISCPPATSYLPRLVAFMRDHPQVSVA